MVVEREKTVDMLGRLGVFCGRTGDICIMLGGEENLRKALKRYIRCLEIFQELSEECGTIDAYRNLANSYEKTGELLLKIGGSENLRKAQEMYQRLYGIE